MVVGVGKEKEKAAKKRLCVGKRHFFFPFSLSVKSAKLFRWRIAMARSGWEAPKLVASLALFLLSGMLEISGGWFVWRALLGVGESGGEEAAIDAGNSSTSTSTSEWRGFHTPPRSSPARLWLLLPGITFLILYGFVPVLQTLVAPKTEETGGEQNQNVATFGRVFAVYGGFFIFLSYLWGWLADGERPDAGDAVGAGVAIVGVLVAWFWPRGARKGAGGGVGG